MWLVAELLSCLVWLASGVQEKGGSSVGDDSLSVYRSTIRPISSDWIKSCPGLINPPLALITSAPARVLHLNISQAFQMVSLFIFCLLCHCLLLPSSILSACMCLLFHVFFFSSMCFFLTYLFNRLCFLLPHLLFSVHLLLSLQRTL